MKTYKKTLETFSFHFFAKNGLSIVHAKFQVPSPKNDWVMVVSTKENPLSLCHYVLQVILQSNSVELSGVGQ